MLTHIIDFIFDVVTNFNLKKLVGILLFVAGLFLVTQTNSASSGDKAVLYAISGIFVGGLGAVIIYYDINRGKIYGHSDFDELKTLEKGIDRQKLEKTRVSTWHIEEKDQN